MAKEKLNEDMIDQALEEAEAAEEETVDTYTHVFAPAFRWEGNEYQKITFNFGKLTGRDAIAIEEELARQNKTVIAPEFSGDYLIRMAARASDPRIGSDAFAAMPLSAYNRIRSKARTFLLVSGR